MIYYFYLFNFKEDINTKTASTDGRTIFYNQEFMSKLGEDEQVFVFAMRYVI